jgi:hypothetical protein
MKLRCDSGVLFGEVIEDTVVEFRCRNRRCGYEPGVLVLHRFDIRTGAVTGTKVYRDAAELTKGERSGADCDAAAVRSA